MNTDGYVKCNGKELAERAKLYIELIGVENARLLDEHRAEVIRKSDEYHRDRSAACYYAESKAMEDMKEVLEPYFVNKTVKHGMLWWYRETIVSNLDLRAVWKNKDAIKDALIQKDSNLWRFLHHVGIEALPDFSRCIEHTKDARLREDSWDCSDFDWYKTPEGWFDIGTLFQMVDLTDTDVFLSINNHFQYVAAGRHYDKLMQSTLVKLDAPLNQSN